MALAYTTQQDFEAYVEGWVTDNPTALARTLERAQRDVDRVLGQLPTDEATGLKLDPATLPAYMAEALSRAVCAQAIWRIRRGEGAVERPRLAKSIRGPEFTVTYADNDLASQTSTAAVTIAPEVEQELEPLRYLRRKGGTATQGRPWLGRRLDGGLRGADDVGWRDTALGDL